MPLLPEKPGLPAGLLVTLVLSMIVAPLYFARSLGVNRVLYSSWASLAAYAAWFICTAYSHSQGILADSLIPVSLGAMWQGVCEFLLYWVF